MNNFKKRTFRLSIITTAAMLASNAALARTTIGDIAETLSFGAGIMNNILWAACIVVGIILLAASFSQYQMHKANPKISPLGVPVTYLLLAILALSIPFIHYVTGVNKDAPPSTKEKRPSYYQNQKDDTDYQTNTDYND